jgi:FixJ family two-component response regulator
MKKATSIVVVEDDDGVLRGIQRLIDAAGYTSVGYTSGEAMLTRNADANVSCVVSDLKLPGMSGLELLAKLRARGRLWPFILITAHDEPAFHEEAVRRGAAYLAKPFIGEALLETIEAEIQRARPR